MKRNLRKERCAICNVGRGTRHNKNCTFAYELPDDSFHKKYTAPYQIIGTNNPFKGIQFNSLREIHSQLRAYHYDFEENLTLEELCFIGNWRIIGEKI